MGTVKECLLLVTFSPRVAHQVMPYAQICSLTMLRVSYPYLVSLPFYIILYHRAYFLYSQYFNLLLTLQSDLAASAYTSISSRRICFGVPCKGET